MKYYKHTESGYNAKRMGNASSICILLIILFSSWGRATADSTKVRFYTFNKGIDKAKKEKKMIIIDFYTDWCHWCKVMEKETFNEKKVAAYLKENYVCIRINAEDTKEEIEYQDKKYNPIQFTQAFGVRGFPSLAFLDNEQKPITIIPGFIPAETFLKILEYIKLECYKKQVSLEDYMKKGCK